MECNRQHIYYSDDDTIQDIYKDYECERIENYEKDFKQYYENYKKDFREQMDYD